MTDLDPLDRAPAGLADLTGFDWDRHDEIAQRLFGKDWFELSADDAAGVSRELLRPRNSTEWDLLLAAQEFFGLDFVDPAMTAEMRSHVHWQLMVRTFARFDPPIVLPKEMPNSWTLPDPDDLDDTDTDRY